MDIAVPVGTAKTAEGLEVLLLWLATAMFSTLYLNALPSCTTGRIRLCTVYKIILIRCLADGSLLSWFLVLLLLPNLLIEPV